MIAYFILVHRYPEQFKKMFKAIYDPNNYYLIHIDKGAGKIMRKDVADFLKLFVNTSLLKSQNVVWGGYSMVEAELRGMKALLALNKQWDHYINLSGQDFPLKSQDEIASFLEDNPKNSYMLMLNQKVDRPITMNRIENYFVESGKGFLGIPKKRKFLKGVVPYIGGQWKILTRSCCEFICTSPKVSKYREFYKNTLIADEGFFQTVLMNTGYLGKVVNDDKRAIVWIPDLGTALLPNTFTVNDTKFLVASGKIKLRPKSFTMSDLPYLLASKALFARKFDQTIDVKVMNALEIRMKNQPSALHSISKIKYFPKAQLGFLRPVARP